MSQGFARTPANPGARALLGVLCSLLLGTACDTSGVDDLSKGGGGKHGHSGSKTTPDGGDGGGSGTGGALGDGGAGGAPGSDGGRDRCADGEQNGTETDIDCGGGTCGACPPHSACAVDSDCRSDHCIE